MTIHSYVNFTKHIFENVLVLNCNASNARTAGQEEMVDLVGCNSIRAFFFLSRFPFVSAEKTSNMEGENGAWA